MGHYFLDIQYILISVNPEQFTKCIEQGSDPDPDPITNHQHCTYVLYCTLALYLFLYSTLWIRGIIYYFQESYAFDSTSTFILNNLISKIGKLSSYHVV